MINFSIPKKFQLVILLISSFLLVNSSFINRFYLRSLIISITLFLLFLFCKKYKAFSNFSYLFFLASFLELALTGIGIISMKMNIPKMKDFGRHFHDYHDISPILTKYSPITGRHLKENFESHNNEGFRKVPSNPSYSTLTINLYGGSTTYDVLISAEDSWANQLQILLNKNYPNKYHIRNLGIPGGTTSEAISFASFYDYHISKSRYPTCSIHYHGWNDLRNNYVPNLNPAFSNWHILNQTNRGPIFGSTYSSLVAFSQYIASISIKYNKIPYEKNAIVENPPQNLDPSLKKIILLNLNTIKALSNKEGGKLLLVPQILNPDGFQNSSRYGWLPNVNDDKVLELIGEQNILIKNYAKKTNTLFSEKIKQDLFESKDFLDNGHFNKYGAIKFAKLILPYVLECSSSY